MISPQELAVQFYLQLVHPDGAVINERYPSTRGRTERDRRVSYFVPRNMHAKAFNPRYVRVTFTSGVKLKRQDYVNDVNYMQIKSLALSPSPPIVQF